MNSEAKKQTILITGINGLIRAMGFLLRVFMSRTLGAEIMGIAELASGVHMMAITPLTSGLPMAISRLTAKEKEQNQYMPLKAGCILVRRVSVILILLLLLLSPVIARLTGDVRTLPSLWFTAPCVMILGYSGVFNGYCYGTGRSCLPAVSELVEQALRLLFTVLLVCLFGRLTAPWMAAVPVASTMLAELGGLALVVLLLRIPAGGEHQAGAWTRPILHLAVPSTVTRLIHTLLRSITSIIIPLRLAASGLAAREATARLGMLNGMVLPMMMLPCIFTGALSLVMAPKLAQSEEKPRLCRQLLIRLFAVGASVSLICTLGMALLAPFFSVVIYRLPELTTLFRAATPLCFLCAAENLTGGTITSLGLQKYTVYGAFPASMTALVTTWILTAMPAFRLNGVIIGLAVGHILCIIWNAGIITKWWRAHSAR